MIRDYATYAHQAQYQWALKLTELFYGKKAKRNYFDGCSDGGRVSMMMAQLFPDDFDGVVVGAPQLTSIAIWRLRFTRRWPRILKITKMSLKLNWMP